MKVEMEGDQPLCTNCKKYLTLPKYFRLYDPCKYDTERARHFYRYESCKYCQHDYKIEYLTTFGRESGAVQVNYVEQRLEGFSSENFQTDYVIPENEDDPTIICIVQKETSFSQSSYLKYLQSIYRSVENEVSKVFEEEGQNKLPCIDDEDNSKDEHFVDNKLNENKSFENSEDNIRDDIEEQCNYVVQNDTDENFEDQIDYQIFEEFSKNLEMSKKKLTKHCNLVETDILIDNLEFKNKDEAVFNTFPKGILKPQYEEDEFDVQHEEIKTKNKKLETKCDEQENEINNKCDNIFRTFPNGIFKANQNENKFDNFNKMYEDKSDYNFEHSSKNLYKVQNKCEEFKNEDAYINEEIKLDIDDNEIEVLYDAFGKSIDKDTDIDAEMIKLAKNSDRSEIIEIQMINSNEKYDYKQDIDHGFEEIEYDNCKNKHDKIKNTHGEFKNKNEFNMKCGEFKAYYNYDIKEYAESKNELEDKYLVYDDKNERKETSDKNLDNKYNNGSLKYFFNGNINQYNIVEANSEIINENTNLNAKNDDLRSITNEKHSMSSHCEGVSFICDVCENDFTSEDDLKTHKNEINFVMADIEHNIEFEKYKNIMDNYDSSTSNYSDFYEEVIEKEIIALLKQNGLNPNNIMLNNEDEDIEYDDPLILMCNPEISFFLNNSNTNLLHPDPLPTGLYDEKKVKVHSLKGETLSIRNLPGKDYTSDDISNGRYKSLILFCTYQECDKQVKTETNPRDCTQETNQEMPTYSCIQCNHKDKPKYHLEKHTRLTILQNRQTEWEKFECNGKQRYKQKQFEIRRKLMECNFIKNIFAPKSVKLRIVKVGRNVKFRRKAKFGRNVKFKVV